MKVRINTKDRLVIYPETDFEEEYIHRFSCTGSTVRGISVNGVVGLVIERVPAALEAVINKQKKEEII